MFIVRFQIFRLGVTRLCAIILLRAYVPTPSSKNASVLKISQSWLDWQIDKQELFQNKTTLIYDVTRRIVRTGHGKNVTGQACIGYCEHDLLAASILTRPQRSAQLQGPLIHSPFPLQVPLCASSNDETTNLASFFSRRPRFYRSSICTIYNTKERIAGNNHSNNNHNNHNNKDNEQYYQYQ